MILEVKNLTKIIDQKKILKNISFTIDKNEIVTLIGPSGAGKSTLLKCLNNLTDYQEGDIFIENKNLKNYTRKTLTDEITIVFQNYHLFPHLTVYENITLPLKLRHTETEENINKKAEKWLHSLKLSDKKNQYPYQLSGGEKQRVAIIRASMLDSKIICFDEPTSALDPSLVNDLSTIIKKIQKENKTIIIITHDIPFANLVSTRIIQIEKGSITNIQDKNKEGNS